MALTWISIELPKSDFLIQAINDDFFEVLSADAYKPSYSSLSREDAILWEFDRYAAFADLLSDVIAKMRAAMDDVDVILISKALCANGEADCDGREAAEPTCRRDIAPKVQGEIIHLPDRLTKEGLQRVLMYMRKIWSEEGLQ